MNPDVLLDRIRLEQRGLIDIHKKLYEMEHLLPIPDPMQFAKTAESAAILSEKSTAHLRNMFFSVSNEPPIYYYPKAAEAQGIRVWASDNYLRVLLPALLPDKKKRDGCKFLLLPLQAALVQSGSLPYFSDCVICPKAPPKRRGRPAKSKTVVATDKESIITKPETEKEVPHGNEQ